MRVPRTVDDFYTGGVKHGTRIRHPERAHGIEVAHQVVVDRLQAERPVDAQPRAQLIGFQHLVGVRVHPGAEFRNAYRIHCQPGCLVVTPELEEQVGAVLERAQHVEVGDAAARPVGDVTIDRQDDRGLVIRVDQLRGGNADHTAVPSGPADDQDVVGADRRIVFDRLPGVDHELGLLLLPAEVFVVQLLRQGTRFVAERFVLRQQQARRDVRRTHAPGGIDARSEDEGDLVTVDGLAGQA